MKIHHSGVYSGAKAGTNQGFTLIEMMVVVVIAAIMMGAVTLSFPSNQADKLLEKEGNRLVALINFAQDEATLQSREFALAFDATGYAFFLNDQGSWIEADGAFSRNNFPDVIRPTLYLEGQAIGLSKKKNPKPQILILSTGEVTPFNYRLSYLNEINLDISVDAGGLVKQRIEKKDAR